MKLCRDRLALLFVTDCVRHYAIWARKFICREAVYSAVDFILNYYRFDSLTGSGLNTLQVRLWLTVLFGGREERLAQ